MPSTCLALSIHVHIYILILFIYSLNPLQLTNLRADIDDIHTGPSI